MEVAIKKMKTFCFSTINTNECKEPSRGEKENDIKIDVGKSLKKHLTKKAKEETIKKFLQDSTKYDKILVPSFYRASLKENMSYNL